MRLIGVALHSIPVEAKYKLILIRQRELRISLHNDPSVHGYQG